MLVGKRNLTIALCGMLLIAFLAWMGGPDNVTDLGPTINAVGVFIGLIIFGRAANKFGETWNGGQPQ